MLYAQSIHNVTIHRAVEGTGPTGPALCGARPRYSEWYGPDRWQFSETMPRLVGAWALEDPANVCCKRCFRKKKEKNE